MSQEPKTPSPIGSVECDLLPRPKTPETTDGGDEPIDRFDGRDYNDQEQWR